MKNRLLAVTTISLAFFTAACGQSAGRLNNQGNAAFAGQDYPAAQEAYRNAQVEAPDQPEPYYNAANTYYRQEDYQQAQLQTRQALRNAGDDLAQHGFFNLGNSYFNGQQFEQAVEAYKQALRLNPADQEAKYNLELALQQLQQQQQQQQQENQDRQDQQNQDQQNQQDNQNRSEDNPPQNQEQQPQQQPQDQNQQPQQPQSQPQVQGLTQEQARQLLEAIAGETETLQERLQQIFVAPGGLPEEDW